MKGKEKMRRNSAGSCPWHELGPAWDWHVHTALYKNPLHSTGALINILSQPKWEKNLKENKYTYVKKYTEFCLKKDMNWVLSLSGIWSYELKQKHGFGMTAGFSEDGIWSKWWSKYPSLYMMWASHSIFGFCCLLAVMCGLWDHSSLTGEQTQQ